MNWHGLWRNWGLNRSWTTTFYWFLAWKERYNIIGIGLREFYGATGDELVAGHDATDTSLALAWLADLAVGYDVHGWRLMTVAGDDDARRAR